MPFSYLSSLTGLLKLSALYWEWTERVNILVLSLVLEVILSASPFRLVLTESLMYVVYIKLRYTVLYMTCLWLLSQRGDGLYRKLFLQLLREVDSFDSLFYCCDVLELLICIGGTLLTSLWMTFLICCWIWADSILWRISVSTFISDIGLRLSLYGHVLYSFLLFKDFLGQ